MITFLKINPFFFLWRYHTISQQWLCAKQFVQSWIDRISLKKRINIKKMHKDTVSVLENLANFKQQPHYNKKWN